MPRGVQAAQIVHAAGESSTGDLSPGTYAIALAVPGQLELEELYAKLRVQGVKCKLITESDAPWSGQGTAIGVYPAPRSQLRRHLSEVPLLR